MHRGGRGGHSSTVPNAVTESALQARKSFYCDLCGKGYGRMNEFEAHESSYDHQHKKRFLEMKQMQKGNTNVEARRERERRQEEKAGLITIKPIRLGGTTTTTSSSGESKETPRKGFKSAFSTTANSAPAESASGGFKTFKTVSEMNQIASQPQGQNNADNESDSDPDYEVYDPEYPTQ